jgi:anti-anti-sigma regulatory factor
MEARKVQFYRMKVPGTKRFRTQRDSKGLGTLFRLYVPGKARGCDLVLINLQARIRALLNMTRMPGVFSVIGKSGHIHF